MPTGTSGLERDIATLRRRAWLFLPFAALGLLAAVFISPLTGESSAVATLALDTTVHDLVSGGDRGLRIFEAQQMTGDPRFREKVIQQIGEPDFNFGRYSISLKTISVADGVSRGDLTVGIADDDREKAELYRQAFVDVFIAEYTADEGLFRTRFIDRRKEVAEETSDEFNKVFAELQAKAEPLGINVLPYVDHRGFISPSTEDYAEQSRLQRELAEVEGAIIAIRGASDGVAAAVASGILGQTVAPGDAAAALTARKTALESALGILTEESAASLAESKLEPELIRLVDEARSLRIVKDEAYIRWANAQIAVRSAESYVSLSYSASGNLAGSMMGRVAVAIAITLVFGLIAIYTVEWLRPSRSS